MINKIIYSIVLLAIVISCNSSQKRKIKRGLVTSKAMVVSAREEASKIGTEILKKGGNVFDAMIATELALAVSYPCAGNIGGGGFMVYRQANGSIGALDYREKAPLKSHKDMYLDKDKNVIKGKSTVGAMGVGVPGTVAGMFAIHKRFGSLPLKTILQPVISLARKGVIITKKQEQKLRYFKSTFKKVNKEDNIFTKNWKAGQYIKHNALANTLERILKNGRDEFYKGETAKKLAAFMQKNGGIITEKDLEKYEVKWRKPITFSYDDLKVISMSPPSSGGICLAQIMKAIEPYDLHTYRHNQAKHIQLISEASRRAYADRSFYLGDPDFIKIPKEELISTDYIKKRMQNFSFEKATLSKDLTYGKVQFNESEETTHYSIVDPFGNAIAATTTINANYGSKLYCAELGFFLNNEMDDFSSKPKVPNMFGLVGAEANAIAPQKRMLSSMTPTIIEKNGKLWMSLGTPGGSMIITSVLQTILNVHEFGFGMQEAVSQPRFHHQWLPDYIKVEPKNNLSKQTKKTLKNKGYELLEKDGSIIGKVEGILVLPNGKLEGGADPRGDDKAAGF